MGVEAHLLAIKSRAHLERKGESSEADACPPEGGLEYAQLGIDFVWPLVCFSVISMLVTGDGSHMKRDEEERVPVIGDHEEGPRTMVHDED